jgi:hypothetical protein
MIDVAGPGEQGKRSQKGKARSEKKPAELEELPKEPETEAAPELASAEEQAEGTVHTQAEVAGEEPASIEQIEQSEAPDDVAMEKAGTGDEITPQAFQDETEVLNMHSRPAARASSTRKGASQKGGARSGKKQTTPKRRLGQQQSRPRKGGEKSRSQTKNR